MKGGKILGQGGYGCVFDYSDTQVAKLVYTTPSHEETGLSQEEFFANQQKIFSLDPEENYFITTRDILNIRMQDLPKEVVSDIVQCQKDYTRRRKKVDIPSTVTLQVQTRVVEAPNLWTPEQVQHAWNGLQLLHSHGYVHGDIDIGNMGFKDNRPVQIDLDFAQEAQPLSIGLRRTGRPFIKTLSSQYQDIQRFDQMLENMD